MDDQTQTQFERLVILLVEEDRMTRESLQADGQTKREREKALKAGPLAYAYMSGGVVGDEITEGLFPDWFREYPEDCEVKLVQGSWFKHGYGLVLTRTEEIELPKINVPAIMEGVLVTH